MVRAKPNSPVASWIVGVAVGGMLLISMIAAAQRVVEATRQLGQGAVVAQTRIRGYP
jgi:hypothetical protein